MPEGSNSELSEDQKRALAFHHKGNYVRLLDAKKAADADLKNGCKKALADGVSVDTIKRLIQLETPGGEAEVAAEIAGIVKAARWAGAQIGEQFDLEDVITDRRTLDEKAYQEGKIAGMKGDSCTGEPYSGAAAQERIRGWHDGQQVLMSALELTKAGTQQEIDGETEAEPTVVQPEQIGRKRRGRPPKNGQAAEPPDADAVKARTAEELAEPIDEIDRPFAERHAAQKARDGAEFEAPPAFN